MTLKKLVLRQPNTQTVILNLAFLLAYLISLTGASEARALPAGNVAGQSGAPQETPTQLLTPETTVTPPPTEIPTLIETVTITPTPTAIPASPQMAPVTPTTAMINPSSSG